MTELITIPHQTVYNLYTRDWKGLITEDSFEHPAKFARGLIFWLVEEGLRQGYWTPGQIIIDPFGGVGLGGLACAPAGLWWVGIELEQRFYRMAVGYDCPSVSKRVWIKYITTGTNPGDLLCPMCMDKKPVDTTVYDPDGFIIRRIVPPQREPHHFIGNFELHCQAYETMGKPLPVMLRGDSRNLLNIIQGAQAEITSPPFTEASKGGGIQAALAGRSHYKITSKARPGVHYTSDIAYEPGNIASMPIGSMPESVAGITSPPYEGTAVEQTHMTSNKRGDPSHPNYRPSWEQKLEDGYAATQRPYSADPDNIGNMPPGDRPIAGITSPPYANRVDDHGVDQPGYEGQSEKLGYYGQSEGQIGNMRLTGITSPPYEGSLSDGHTKERTDGTAYTYNGGNPDNIGNAQGETYWGAVAIIYQQLYQLFQPGGHLAVVVKSFVRNKQIVDLPNMTLSLLVSIGWEPVQWYDCSLVSEAAQGDMFAPGRPHIKEDKSFFRHLHEATCRNRAPSAKDGAYHCKLLDIDCPYYKAARIKPQWAPKDCEHYINAGDVGTQIDHEVVLVVKKPGEGISIVGITSPPYGDVASRNRSQEPFATTLALPGFGMAEGQPNRTIDGYGDTPGQIGSMPIAGITSPPYIDSIQEGHGGTGDTGRPENRVDWREVDTSYGSTPGQIGAMKEGGITWR